MLQKKLQQSDTQKIPPSRCGKVPCWELAAREIVLKILKDCKHCIVYKRNHYRNSHNGAVSG